MAFKFTPAFLASLLFLVLCRQNFSESRLNEGMIFLCTSVLPRRKAVLSYGNPYDPISVLWDLGQITDKLTVPHNLSTAVPDSSG